MSKKKTDFQIGPRDFELLTAIDRCAMTVKQLRRLSETFDAPFTDDANLRRRLRTLADASIIRKFAYAIASEGRSPYYYKLTRDGYRMLHGNGVPFPKHRYFEAISPGHHYHTNALAEMVVHLCITARRNDAELLHFARENSVKLVAEPFTLYPDSAFVIRRSDGRTFPFVVELDRGTERVHSKQDVESIERKIRGYDAHQSKFGKFDPDRYLVLFITTRSKRRLKYIFDVAAELITQPKRRVFVGCELKDFLATDPFQTPVFQDHRGLKRHLIPLKTQKERHQSIRSASLLPNLAS